MYNKEYEDHDFGIKCDGKHGCTELTIVFHEDEDKFYCANHATEKVRELFIADPEGHVEYDKTNNPGVCDDCGKDSAEPLWEDDYDKICIECIEDKYMDEFELDSVEDWGMRLMRFMEQSELEAYANERGVE